MTSENIKLEYIRIQWADIHHSRNQTWQALVIIAGLYASLGQIENKPVLIIIISVAGIIISYLAALICKSHKNITEEKTSIIEKLEYDLGLPKYPTRKAIIPVHMTMFIIFGISCFAFACIFVHNINYELKYELILLIIPISLIYILTYYWECLYKKLQKKA